MKYAVEILRSAQKQLAGVDQKQRRRIVAVIRQLGEDPRPRSAKKLTARPAWRIRVGDYRVIYEIHDQRLIVLVVALGHRREVYR